MGNRSRGLQRLSVMTFRFMTRGVVTRDRSRSRDRVRHYAAPVLAVALVMAACGGGAAGGDPADVDPDSATITSLASDETTTTAAPDESDGGTTVTTTAPNDGDGGGGSDAGQHSDLVAFAMADLSERMDTPMEEIILVSQEDVTWRDGSLGCPQPGFNYTQALVDGYKITLQIGSTEYAYHGKAGHDPFLCAPDLTGEKTDPVNLEPKEEGGSDDLSYDE